MVQILLFVLGLFMGSFFNVIIYRLPRNESIVFPPSHCPKCRHRLYFFDLIPVLSYILLNSKCRYCREPISIIYPLTELLTAFSYILIYTYAQFNLVYLVYLLLIVSVFIIIFFTDLKYGVIPFQVVGFGLAAVIVYLLYTFSYAVFSVHILSAIGAFFFFLMLFVFTKGRGMGFGDVVLVLLIGLFLGFPNTVFALYIAFLSGALISLLLIFLRIKKLHHDTIPFGPFLVSGTLISLFLGTYIFEIFKHFII